MRKLILAIAICALPLAAQQGRRSIQGTVTDSTGAAVPGAPGLPVGEYFVSVEQAGFKTAVRRGIALQADQRAAANMTPEVGRSTNPSTSAPRRRWWILSLNSASATLSCEHSLSEAFLAACEGLPIQRGSGAPAPA